MSNGYPERTVWRMLYQEDRREHNKEDEIDMAKSMYVPYHPRAKRLYKMLKEEFGFSVVFKKTQTLGDILLKKEEALKNSLEETPFIRYHAKSAQ